MTGEIGKLMEWLEGFLWSVPFIFFVLAMGFYYLIATKFFVIRYFGHIFAQTLGSLIKNKESISKREGYISPFEAVCIAIGGCVGAGNIAGVATAIAVGGPGALFWLIMFGFLAMAIKLAEAALGSHYRHKDEAGRFTGGPMWYMEKGIGREMGMKIGFGLAFFFCIAFMSICLQGSQVYTIAEVLNAVHGTDMIMVTLVYTALIYIFIWGGLQSVAKVASRLVPFMCVAYILAALGVIFMNLGEVPGAIYLICHDALNGTAAVGGFAGAGVVAAMRSGVVRAINSCEAGQGSSAFAHSPADTVHPIRQGLWGCIEGFVDIVVVCTITSLVIVISGVWNSGTAGGALSYMAFKTEYGQFGGYLLSLILVTFGLTTTTGWYVYYNMVIEYFFRDNPISRDRAVLAFKLIFPAINIVIVSYITLTGNGPVMFWTLISILIVPGILVNLVALFLLRGKVFALLADYKARYMGIGTVDPNFSIFYEDDPEVFQREEALREELRRIVREKRAAAERPEA